MADGQAVGPSELALNSSQLSLLKRQIATLKALNGRLKAFANGVKPMPIVNLGSKRGKNVNPLMNNKQGGGRKNKKMGSGSDSSGDEDQKEGSDTDEEEDVEDVDSDDSEEAELSDSSLSAGKPVGKRGSIPTEPTRRTPRSLRQKPVGMLKEASSNENSDDEDSDNDSDGNTPTNTTGGKKSGPSPKKKRKLFVVVGGEPNNSGAQAEVKLVNLKPIKGAWTTGEDAVCSICGDGDGTDENLILLCEGHGCEVAVHQMCYGVSKIPEGEWLCDPCAVKKKKKGTQYQCAVCPVQGGALRRINTFGKVVPAEGDGGKGKGKTKKEEKEKSDDTWVHIACALWTPGIAIDDPTKMDKINVSGLNKERVDLKCTLCSQAGGAVVQCSYGSCCRGFHVLCGRFAGYQLTFSLDGEPLAFCNVHSRAKYSRMRQAMSEGKNAEEAMAIAAAGEEESEDEGVVATPDRELNEYEKQRAENLERIAEARKALLGGK